MLKVKLKKFLKIIFVTILITVFTLIFLAYVIPLPSSEYFLPQDLADERGSFINIDGYEGFYIDINQKSEGVLVFIHGFGAGTHSYDQLISELETEDLRLIAIDLKGFGMSEKVLDTDYSHKAQAKYVVKLLSELDVDSAVFVGHSMGGSVVSHIAREYPELIEGQILIAPAILHADEIRATRILGTFPFKRISQQIMLRTTDEKFMQELAISANYPKLPDPNQTTKYLKPLQIKDWELSLIGVMRDAGKNGVKLETINKDLPTLIIWGADDSWVPIENANKLTSYYTNHKLVTLENTGHVPQETNAKDVTEIILQFLILFDTSKNHK